MKVKSVYAEYLPSSWDEEKVTDYFKKFGEIENVALARNLRSSKRKDFAFVNFTTREAALACIEAFSRDQLNDQYSKVVHYMHYVLLSYLLQFFCIINLQFYDL